MHLENPKTGTLRIVYESPISEKTVLTFFFAKKKCSKMKLHELYIDGKKKCQILRDMGQKMGESRIFCIQAILTDCSKAKSTRSRESRIPISRLSKMTSDV